VKEEHVRSKLDHIAHVCTRFDLSVHTKAGVHTRGDLHPIGIWKLARPDPPQDPLWGRDVPRKPNRFVFYDGFLKAG